MASNGHDSASWQLLRSFLLLCDSFLHRDILHLAAYDFKASYVSLAAGSEMKNLKKALQF